MWINYEAFSRAMGMELIRYFKWKFLSFARRELDIVIFPSEFYLALASGSPWAYLDQADGRPLLMAPAR